MAIYLDTEYAGRKLLEVAIIDENGNPLLDTRVRPESMEFDSVWALTANRVHHIYPDDVADAPSQREVVDAALNLVRDQEVVIFNAPADARFFPGIGDLASALHCAMRASQRAFQATALSLDRAMSLAGVRLSRPGRHTALTDALACRALWRVLRDLPQRHEEDCTGWIQRDLALSVMPARSDVGSCAPGAPVNAGKLWTPQLRQRLWAYRPTADGVRRAADDLNRTPRAIAYQMANLGMLPREAIEQVAALATAPTSRSSWGIAGGPRPRQRMRGA